MRSSRIMAVPGVPKALPPCHQFWEQGPEGDPVRDLQPMRDALDRWFKVAFEDGPLLPTSAAFHHHFAGLLMLADWLGSDARFFPFANGTDQIACVSPATKVPTALAAVGLAAESTRAPRCRRTLSFQVSLLGRERHGPIQVEAAVPRHRLSYSSRKPARAKQRLPSGASPDLFKRGHGGRALLRFTNPGRRHSDV